jgi:hypothetical protein
LTSVDRVQKLLPYLDRKPLLRFSSAERFLSLGVRRQALLPAGIDLQGLVGRFNRRLSPDEDQRL